MKAARTTQTHAFIKYLKWRGLLVKGIFRYFRPTFTFNIDGHLVTIPFCSETSLSLRDASNVYGLRSMLSQLVAPRKDLLVGKYIPFSDILWMDPFYIDDYEPTSYMTFEAYCLSYKISQVSKDSYN